MMCTSGQLVHCLAGRLTHLQQCCGSLVAAPVSAVRLDSTARWFLLQAQQKRVGTVQFPYRDRDRNGLAESKTRA